STAGITAVGNSATHCWCVRPKPNPPPTSIDSPPRFPPRSAKNRSGIARSNGKFPLRTHAIERSHRRKSAQFCLCDAQKRISNAPQRKKISPSLASSTALSARTRSPDERDVENFIAHASRAVACFRDASCDAIVRARICEALHATSCEALRGEPPENFFRKHV